MIVLGIESSCDETGAALVEMCDDGSLKLLSSKVSTSVDLHEIYGGVVPEIAARSHIEYIMPAINSAINEGLSNEQNPWNKIDAIAVTYGPGLGGSLLVGLLTARTLALRKNKPLYGINHVAAHPIANFISKAPDNYKLPEQIPQFPILALIVSGGHTQLVLYKDTFDYKVLGRTTDDAVGEAFDKVAKVLGLPYPGGPSIEKKSEEGDKNAFKLPKPNTENKYDFSYSGLKTAVLRLCQKLIGEDYHFPSTQMPDRLTDQQVADIAASFSNTAIETLVDKTVLAYEEFQPKNVVIAGGVAASRPLRSMLADRLPIEPIYTDMKLCIDNGAMIAALGCYMHHENIEPSDPYTLDISPSLSM